MLEANSGGLYSGCPRCACHARQVQRQDPTQRGMLAPALSASGGRAQSALRCDAFAVGDPGHLVGVSTNHDDR